MKLSFVNFTTSVAGALFLMNGRLAWAAEANPTTKTAFSCEVSAGGSRLDITILSDLQSGKPVSASWVVSGLHENSEEYKADQISASRMSGDEARGDNNLSSLLGIHAIDPAKVAGVNQFTLSEPNAGASGKTSLFDAVDAQGKSLLKGYSGQGTLPVICDK